MTVDTATLGRGIFYLANSLGTTTFKVPWLRGYKICHLTVSTGHYQRDELKMRYEHRLKARAQTLALAWLSKYSNLSARIMAHQSKWIIARDLNNLTVQTDGTTNILSE